MYYAIRTFLTIALLPLTAGYVWLCFVMRAAGIERPPYGHFFLVFGAVGSLLLTFSFGPVYLIAFMSPVSLIVAPAFIFINSFVLYREHQDSKYHKAAFWSGLAYVGLVMVMAWVASYFE